MSPTPRAEEKASRWVPIVISIGMGILAIGIGYGTTSVRVDDHEKRIAVVEAITPKVPEHERRLTAVEATQAKMGDIMERLDRRSLLMVCKQAPNAAECQP